MKEGKSRRKAVLRVAAIGGVLITAAFIALYTPWLGLFDLREISVSGNRQVPAREVARVTGLRRGQSLFTISVHDIAAKVTSLPWVKDVAVQRVYPHGVSVRIQERIPVAKVLLPSGEGCLTLGEGGVVVEEDCESTASLVELIGASLTGEDPGERLFDDRVTLLMDCLFHAQLHDFRLHEIDVSDPDSIVLKAESGLRVLLGDIEGVSRRVDALVALCRTINVGNYELIDLRFGGEATLVPR